MYASVIVAVDPATDPTQAVATADAIATAVGCPVTIVHVATSRVTERSEWLSRLQKDLTAPSRTMLIAETKATTALLDLQAANTDSLLCMATCPVLLVPCRADRRRVAQTL